MVYHLIYEPLEKKVDFNGNYTIQLLKKRIAIKATKDELELLVKNIQAMLEE